jgi:hypothetical protein
MTTPEDQVQTVADAVRAIEDARLKREQSERSFTLAGETFTHKPTAEMEALADYYDMTSGRKDVNNHEAIEIIDRTVLAFLEPGQEEKWAKVRHSDQHPLSVGDAHGLIEALLGATTGRPTMPPSDSGGGPESNGTTSTADSPSKEQTSAA